MKEEEFEADLQTRLTSQKPSISPNDQKNKIKNNNDQYIKPPKDSENHKFTTTSHSVFRNSEKQAINNIRLDPKTKKALQIIRYDSRNKFEFNDEAEEVLYCIIIQYLNKI